MSWIEQTLQNVLTKRLFQDMFNDMKSEQSRIGHSTTDEINKMKVASENNGKIVDHLKNEMEKMRSKQEAYNNLLMQLSKEWLIFYVNPHAPDQFTPSRARCAEIFGSALTYR